MWSGLPTVACSTHWNHRPTTLGHDGPPHGLQQTLPRVTLTLSTRTPPHLRSSSFHVQVSLQGLACSPFRRAVVGKFRKALCSDARLAAPELADAKDLCPHVPVTDIWAAPAEPVGPWSMRGALSGESAYEPFVAGFRPDHSGPPLRCPHQPLTSGRGARGSYARLYNVVVGYTY